MYSSSGFISYSLWGFNAFPFFMSIFYVCASISYSSSSWSTVILPSYRLWFDGPSILSAGYPYSLSLRSTLISSITSISSPVSAWYSTFPNLFLTFKRDCCYLVLTILRSFKFKRKTQMEALAVHFYASINKFTSYIPLLTFLDISSILTPPLRRISNSRQIS